MKLTKEDIPKLEQYWKNYEELKGRLAYRRYELLYQPQDTNVGGGKSNLPSSPVENEVIKLYEDNEYRNLQAIIQAIEDVYRKADDIQKDIIEYRYWDKDLTVTTWEDVAHEITKKKDGDTIISSHSAKRIRTKILLETAKQIGWVSCSS
ncbi:MAG: transcriptional regulator [Staphylococcus pseudoxylosus]|uniref:transcriptional regulator n=1 Tax=Staphylococcus pseudoxylosus TaxID=2282419 RepID=UPI0031F651EE